MLAFQHKMLHALNMAHIFRWQLPSKNYKMYICLLIENNNAVNEVSTTNAAKNNVCFVNCHCRNIIVLPRTPSRSSADPIMCPTENNFSYIMNCFIAQGLCVCCDEFHKLTCGVLDTGISSNYIFFYFLSNNYCKLQLGAGCCTFV